MKSLETAIRYAALIVLITLTIGSAVEDAYAWPYSQEQQGKKAPDTKPVPVAVAPVTIGVATSRYNTTATLEAEHRAQILARTNGVVEEMLREEGDFVEEGQVLLRLEDDEYLLNLKMARIKVKNLEREYERLTKMFEGGILSPQDHDKIQNDLAQARAEVEKSELTLSYTEVRAPFTGVIVRRYLDKGAHVQSGTALFELMDTDPLLARIHIPANRMGSVQPGQDLGLRLDSSGQALKASIRLVSPIVDANTGTVKVTAEIRGNPKNTRPGDFVEADIVTASRDNAMLVASIAIFEEQGEQIVYTVENNTAKRKVVKVGFVEQGISEIREGLQESDLVVVKGQRNLREGMPVEILERKDLSREASL